MANIILIKKDKTSQNTNSKCRRKWQQIGQPEIPFRPLWIERNFGGKNELSPQ
jgi:hypothetical protein